MVRTALYIWNPYFGTYESASVVGCSYTSPQFCHVMTKSVSRAVLQVHKLACRVGDHVMDKELIYEKLPADIAERHVLLMDPILATGNSAVRAIQVGMVLTWTSQHKERASPMPAEEPCRRA